MTRTVTPPVVSHAAIAAALAALRALLLAGHVTLRDLWLDPGSGPGAVVSRPDGPVVEVTIEHNPAALDALLSGMTLVEGPTRWSGHHYEYQDWRGLLLTMPLLITQRIDQRPVSAAAAVPAPAAADEPAWSPETGFFSPDRVPGPHPDDDSPIPVPAPVESPPLPGESRAACADHPDFVPRGLSHLRQHIEQLHVEPLDRAQFPGYVDDDPGAPGLVRPYVDDADPRPLLELVHDERFLAPPAPPVVPGPVIERSVEEAWSIYARARAVHYFGTKRYPSIAEARKAVEYWPGYDMLLPGDLDIVAGALVDPPRTPEPEPASSRRNFAPWRRTVRTETAR